jgi:hypothetical protein
MIGEKAAVVGTLEDAKGVKTIAATEFEEIEQRAANRAGGRARAHHFAHVWYRHCHQHRRFSPGQYSPQAQADQ